MLDWQFWGLTWGMVENSPIERILEVKTMMPISAILEPNLKKNGNAEKLKNFYVTGK